MVLSLPRWESGFRKYMYIIRVFVSCSALCIVVLVDSVWHCHYLVERAGFRKYMYIIRVFVSYSVSCIVVLVDSIWHCHYLVERSGWFAFRCLFRYVLYVILWLFLPRSGPRGGSWGSSEPPFESIFIFRSLEFDKSLIPYITLINICSAYSLSYT